MGMCQLMTGPIKESHDIATFPFARSAHECEMRQLRLLPMTVRYRRTLNQPWLQSARVSTLTFSAHLYCLVTDIFSIAGKNNKNSGFQAEGYYFNNRFHHSVIATAQQCAWIFLSQHY